MNYLATMMVILNYLATTMEIAKETGLMTVRVMQMEKEKVIDYYLVKVKQMD